jgi:hypothetical protein
VCARARVCVCVCVLCLFTIGTVLRKRRWLVDAAAVFLEVVGHGERYGRRDGTTRYHSLYPFARFMIANLLNSKKQAPPNIALSPPERRTRLAVRWRTTAANYREGGLFIETDSGRRVKVLWGSGLHDLG